MCSVWEGTDLFIYPNIYLFSCLSSFCTILLWNHLSNLSIWSLNWCCFSTVYLRASGGISSTVTAFKDWHMTTATEPFMLWHGRTAAHWYGVHQCRLINVCCGWRMGQKVVWFGLSFCHQARFGHEMTWMSTTIKNKPSHIPMSPNVTCIDLGMTWWWNPALLIHRVTADVAAGCSGGQGAESDAPQLV